MKGFKSYFPGFVCRGIQSISCFINSCVDFLVQKTAVNDDIDSSGDSVQLAASCNSAYLVASRNYAKLAASGDLAQLAASGDFAQLSASGDAAKLFSSGYAAKLAVTGNYAELVALGDNSVVAGIGIGNTVKSSKGSWITLAEWIWDDKKVSYIPVCVKSEFVDGERIKSDVVYKLHNGEFVEV